MRRRLGPLALLALLGSACGEPRLVEGFASEGQTRIRLVPSEFVGGVPCQRDVAGALQTYIALLQDMNPNAPPDASVTTAYSTGPVPCDQAVLFPAVAGRLYGAEIYGFDSDTPSEEDLGSARWSALCGRGRPSFEPSDAGLDPYRPTVATRGFTVPLRGCQTFSGGPGEPQPRLVVDTASALGSLRCGTGSGEVYALRGTLEGVTRVALCEEPLVFDAPVPNRYYTIELTGLAADGDAGAPVTDAGAPSAGDAGGLPLDASVDAALGDAFDASASSPVADSRDAGATPEPSGTPRWETSCIGRALAGATAPAVCEPLRALSAAAP